MADDPRILIADHDEGFVRAASRHLVEAGFSVDWASSAPDARSALADDKVDLLIVDTDLPGLQSSRYIDDVVLEKSRLPVVAVASEPSLDFAVRAVASSVDAYLIKPIDPAALVDVVSGSVDRGRAVRAVIAHSKWLAEWRREFDQVESALLASSGDSQLLGLEAFLALTTRNVITCMSDLRQVCGALARETREQPACSLMNCPTLALFTETLMEAISVLEKTKHSFKSKDLGTLRKRLKSVVGSLPQ